MSFRELLENIVIGNVKEKEYKNACKAIIDKFLNPTSKVTFIYKSKKEQI